MAGRKQFDEEAAIDAAMRVFWADGWHGASLPRLRTATGLSSSSFYNAFGDKAGLYEKALRRYRDRLGGRMRAGLEQPGIRGAIAAFLAAFTAQLDDPDVPTGCFAAQACFDTGGSDGVPTALAAEALEAPRRALLDRLDRAVADGGLPGDFDTAAYADLIMVTLRGVAAAHRATGDRHWAENSFALVLDMLPSSSGQT